MSELPWSKFFWSDWEADQGVRLSSLAAQGLWMRMLCVCAKGDPKGYLAINGKPLGSTDVARLCGISAEEVDALMEELSANGVFSRDRRGWIYSRRMLRDAKKSATGKKFAKKRWEQATESEGEKPRPNRPPNGEPTPQRPEARGQNNYSPDLEDEFAAWWEHVPLKVGKGNARPAYKKARKKAEAAVLLEGIRRYAASVAGKEPQFIAHPTTWLNGERWADEGAAPGAGSSELSDDDFLRRVERQHELLGRVPPMPVQDEVRYRRLKEQAA